MNIQDMIDKINKLKVEKDAIILAHNYQLPEIQDIADFAGDSLQLARKASEISNPIIVFCGVYFMAETAAILNPDKKVLIPDEKAGCPLADFATGAQVREMREKYPDHTFVAYINSTAEVKAEIDVCCTSSNALKVVERCENDKIVFLPDKNLGGYIKTQTDKEIVLWPGYCVVHETADLTGIKETIAKHPNAITMAHPECPANVLEQADEICSTGQMFDVVKKCKDTKEFIVVTECGMVHALKKAFPDREFIEPAIRLQCRNMKKITLEKVLSVLENENKQVKVDNETAKKAKQSIDKMLTVK